MKYWLLTTEYPPFFGGGISTYCKQTASALSNKGYDVTVFVYDASIDGNIQTYNEDVRIVRFGDTTGAARFLGYTAAVAYEYANIVKAFICLEGKPDVIESQEYNAIAYYVQQFKLQKIAPFENLKIVITCHSPSFICLEYNKASVYKFPEYWTGYMEKACIVSADLLILPSQYLYNELVKHVSLDNVSYKILPNPYEITNSSDGASQDEKYITCFGKLAPLKGSFELLKLFKELWDCGFKDKLYIAGGVDYFLHTENKPFSVVVKEKYGAYLENGLLVLLGNLEPQAAQEHLLKSKLIIVPSLFDNFPYTVLESMALGKIVLASKQGGQSEIIEDGVDGFLFDHKKENAFKVKLLEVLASDQQYLGKIKDNAKAKILKSYNSTLIAERKMQYFDELVANSKDNEIYPFVEQIECNDVLSGGHSLPSTKGLLSVVIPYYNMGDYIEDCIISVYNNTYLKTEVIIINDGSTEQKSVDKLSVLAKKYPDLKIINQVNKGLPATRNIGAEVALGEFIAFLDADDKVQPNYYSKALSILQNYRNVHFVGCWLKYFGEGSGTWPTFNPEPPYLLIHNVINSSSVVFKKASFVMAGKNDPELVFGMEDWDTIISLTSKGLRGVSIPETLFDYRVRKGSMSQSFTRAKQLYLQKLIAEKHRDFYGRYAPEIFLLLNSNGSSLYFDNPTFEVVPAISSQKLSRISNKLKTIVKRNQLLKKVAYKIYTKINSN